MSRQQSDLCSTILHQHFGENVQIVGECLFSAVQSRSLSMIIKSTGLPKIAVCNALAILLKFQLAKFVPSSNENFAEYSINRENVLLILRYPRYVHQIQTKFGAAATSIIEELLRAGSQTASYLVAQCSDQNIKGNLEEHKNAFISLCTSCYIFRAPERNKDSTSIIPKFIIEDHTLYQAPTIDLQEIIKLKTNPDMITSDSTIFWLVNTDRFHQDFRDALLMNAIERKIDSNASECVKFIFQQMYVNTQPWAKCSNPINFIDISHLVERKSTNNELAQYLQEYLNIIMDDQLKLISKTGTTGGGQYVVQMQYVIEQLTWVCIENIISEKFGSKASRIFRVIRFRGYCEQEDIQKDAMIPAKEAKLLTYKLLEEHFLQIKPIRKPGGGGTGMAKAFFLFYVDQNQIVGMLLEICYKALFNSMTRSTHSKNEHKRLIEKSQRLESIVEAMKERGESEEYIAEIFETLTPPEREILQKVKVRIKNLYSAEIGLDETMFLFQMYQQYRRATV